MMFEPCDCGSGKSHIACCGRLHAGAPAPDAEALMRSRYSAYRRRNVAYLLRSWAVETRPATLELDVALDWIGLEIQAHRITGPDTATVKFTASWFADGKAGQMTETSRFRREGQGWVYIDGKTG